MCSIGRTSTTIRTNTSDNSHYGAMCMHAMHNEAVDQRGHSYHTNSKHSHLFWLRSHCLGHVRNSFGPPPCPACHTMKRFRSIGPVPIDAGIDATGTVRVVRVDHQFKAVLSKYSKKTGKVERAFGTRRPTVAASIQQLADSKMPLISKPELIRLIDKMRDLTPYECNADDNRRDKVKVFHQIYGVFCDGKPMSALFQKSQDRWKKVASDNGGIYHCWGPLEIETIIKVFFIWLWPLYDDGLRFPHIQRVDIGRICILILCGGMYIDLDVLPNRDVYYQVPFAVCRIDRTAWKKTTKKKQKYNLWLEIEAIIADPRNPLLTRWLRFVVDRVIRTGYGPGRFWHIAKARYVMYTTGPTALNAFLAQKHERETVRSLRFIACNVQKLQQKLSAKEQRTFDVVSYDSASWINPKALWVAPPKGTQVPLETLLKTLPIMRITRRVSGKMGQSYACASNTMTPATWIGGMCLLHPEEWDPEWEKDGVDYDKCAAFINGIIRMCDIADVVFDTTTGKKLFRGLPPALQLLCQRR